MAFPWIVAGALAVAQPVEGTAMDLFEPIPSRAVREGDPAGAAVELVVTPDGRVRECTLLDHVGSERLAR